MMNSDDPNELVSPGQHTHAMNIVFRGNGAAWRAQNIPGNKIIVNTNLPEGDNECIGAYYDNLRQRIYWFNYNSNGDHGIYYYDLATKVIFSVIVLGQNGGADALIFNLDNPIFSAKILYGDDTQGDTLLFNNSIKVPCQINVKMALDGSYGATILSNYLNVIKAPSPIPPNVIYLDDSPEIPGYPITVNNLRKKLFKFKQRYVYENAEKSVFSSHSEIAIPNNYLDSAVDKDPTKNAVIGIVFQTGPANVRKIELAACQNLNSLWGDFFSIQVLDKDELGLPDNDIAIFYFKNDQAYVSLEVLESEQLFDTVPLEANDLELLNGNVLIYGGIKEGYNNVPLIAVSTAGTYTKKTSNVSFLFQASQSGNSGFGTGDIHIIVLGKITEDDTFPIQTTTNTSTYVASAGETPASVISGLAISVGSAGFTIVSSDDNNLVIRKTGESLLRAEAVSAVIESNNSLAYDYNSSYDFGIVYFDANGRTPQVVTTSGLSVQTINYSDFLPEIDISISSRPPTWAFYYQIVRSKNKTKERTLYWVTDRTFKDVDYAYVSRESLMQEITI